MKEIKRLGFLCITLCLLLAMTVSVFATPDPSKHNEVGNDLIESVKALDNTTIEVIFAGEVKDKKVEFAINEMYGSKQALEIKNINFSDDNKIATITTSSQKGSILYKILVKDIQIKHLGKTNEISKIFVGIAPKQNQEPSLVKIAYAIPINSSRVDVAFDMEVDISNAKFSITDMSGAQALGVIGYALNSDKMTVSINTTPQEAGRIYTLKVSDIKTLDGKVSNTLSQLFAGTNTPPPSLGITSAIAIDNTRVDVLFNTEADLSNASITFTDMMGMRQTLTTTGYEMNAYNDKVTIFTSPQSAGVLYKVVISGAKTLDGNTASNLSILFAGIGPAN